MYQKGIFTGYCVKKLRALLMPEVWYPGPTRVNWKRFEHVLDVVTYNNIEDKCDIY